MMAGVLSDKRLAALLSRPPPRNPSRRTPDRDTTRNNADNVERYLQNDGHRVLGWVIYRCTYGSDKDWVDVMQRIKFYINQDLERVNGLDMLQSLDFHVFDDRALFDGASTATIRQHFQEWASTASIQEQGTEEWRESQRYRYCLQVDEESLHSILSNPPPPQDSTEPSFISLIWADWEPTTADEIEDENLVPDDDYEEIEDCTENDVGWMRSEYQWLMSTWYCLFRDSGAWEREYRRPPAIASSQDFSEESSVTTAILRTLVALQRRRMSVLWAVEARDRVD